MNNLENKNSALENKNSAEESRNSAPDGMKLVWADEFDQDGAPDPAKWGFEHGFVRNEEEQWYSP